MRILKEKKVKGLWKNLENKKKREAIRKLKMKKKTYKFVKKEKINQSY